MESAVDKFIAQMGLLAKDEGSPRIAGQIMGYLMVEGEPRTLGQMTERLKISKASASTNARLLERHGSLKRVESLGTRQDAYVIADDPERQMMELLSKRLRASADEMAKHIGPVGKENPDAAKRVAQFADFYVFMAEMVEDWCDREELANWGKGDENE